MYRITRINRWITVSAIGAAAMAAVLGAWSSGVGQAGADPITQAPTCCSHTHARAQALVKADGTAARQFGVSGTSRASVGVYCVVLPPTLLVSTTAPVATQDVALSPSPLTTTVTVAINSAAPACAPNSVEVHTFADTPANGRTPADEAFTVVIS
jgi:hypothetical protein